MNLGTDTMDKYAEIDADLETEFEEGVAEEEAEIVNEPDEVVEDETTETEVSTEDEGSPSEEIEDTPANRAFAELRVRNKELEESQAKKDKIIRMVMEGSGLEDEDQFIQALEKTMSAQEQATLQMDDKSYATLEAERREKQAYQQRLKATEAQLQDRNLNDFNYTLDTYEREYGFTRDEIFEDLARGGVTVDTIRASTNHDNLIKTNMIDKIIEVRARKAYEKEAGRGKVDEVKLSGASTDGDNLSFEEMQDALIEKEIEEYKKSKKY